MIGKKCRLEYNIQLFVLSVLLLSCVLQGGKVAAQESVSASLTNIGIDRDSSSNQGSKSQSSSTQQTGLTLDFQFDFGKAKYGDGDGNGFDNATILGYGLDAGWDFGGPWSLWTSFKDLNSYDALSVYPGYELLDPNVTSDETGTLTNMVLDGGVTYRFENVGTFNQLKVGIGWLDYNFKAKEYGYLETRDYHGVEVLLHVDKKLNDRLTVQGSFKLAPMLTTDDRVKGDVNDPNRTANTSYNGYLWGTQWGLQIALNKKMWLETGFSYQLLHGEGHEHPEYRFLEHDYTNYGFYALFGTRLNLGARIVAEPQPQPQSVIENPIIPTPLVQAPQIVEPVIHYPGVTIVKITPDAGIVNTKVNLTIEGTWFRPGIKVTFYKDQVTLPVTDLVLISETQISCSLDLKDAVVGTYDVTVTNEDGQSSGIRNAFMIKQPEQSNSHITVSPRKGFNNGSLLITLKGPDILPGTTVKMNNPVGTIVPAEIIEVQPGKIVGFFHLKGQSEGFYDFYLFYPDGHSKKVEESFEVVAFSKENNKSKTLLQVYFDVSKASVSTVQIKSIKDQLPLLLINPNAKIILVGYTDARGSYSYNLALSMHRAEAVKEILLANGIKPEQISIYAYGKEQAKQGVNDNVWRNDRRVEVVIYEEN
jgi:hypothetical protein